MSGRSLEDLEAWVGQIWNLVEPLGALGAGGDHGQGERALIKNSAKKADYTWHPVVTEATSSTSLTAGQIIGIMISDLDAATDPLSGTEPVPIVQGANTVRTTTQKIANLVPIAVVFSYPGALDNNVQSPRWYPTRDVTFTKVRVSLLANASSDHVIQLLIGGAPFASYTLTAGNATMTATISAAVAATQAVTIKTTTVSDSDLSVQLNT